MHRRPLTEPQFHGQAAQQTPSLFPEASTLRDTPHRPLPATCPTRFLFAAASPPRPISRHDERGNPQPALEITCPHDLCEVHINKARSSAKSQVCGIRIRDEENRPDVRAEPR